jgi:hypothetical protein
VTSIGDKLVLQLPLTSVTQSLEQIAGDAAINTAKAIGGSETTDASEPLLPAAGIASDPSVSPGGQVASSDFTASSGMSDALMGLRPPSNDGQAMSYGSILQTAQSLASPDLASEQGETSGAASTNSGGDTAPASARVPGAAPSQANAAAAMSMPTAAGSVAALDQRPGAVTDPTASAEGGADVAVGGVADLPEGTAALFAELSETGQAAGAASSGQAAETTPSAQAANSQVFTTVEARFDGSLMATEVISRPDTPQIMASVVTSNLATTATADKIPVDTKLPTGTPQQVGSSDGGDIVTWQVDRHDTGASFATIDIGAKQSATWSDAQDQSRARAPVDEPTRASTETNGFDAPRPAQSIATGALVGSVLSSEQPDGVQPQPVLPPDQLADTGVDLKTGIASSGILNAAMIPGWPQPQLAGRMQPEEALARGGATRGMSDEEMLTYLANLGADDEMLDKVKKALKKPVAGRKIVFYLASLATAVSVVFKSLAGEVETMVEEDAETAEARKRADARGQKTSRHRLYLE